MKDKTELHEALRLIRLWHRWHDMTPPDVVLVYPNPSAKYDAEAHLKLELGPKLRYAAQTYSPGYTFEGVNVTFDYHQPKYGNRG